MSILQSTLPSRLTSDLGPIRPGVFVLVYFSTAACAACKTVQRLAIERVSKLLWDSLQVFEIDAMKEPEVALRWGVVRVPAIFLINPRGELHYVSHGVVGAEQLLIQMHTPRVH